MSIKKEDLFSVHTVLRVLTLLILGFALFYKESILPVGAVIVALIIFDIYAPKIVNLSKDNPKVGTLRRLNRLSILIILLVLLTKFFKPSELSVPYYNKEIVMMGLVSILMMVFGNSAPKLPRSRYLGLRLPWTIRDEDTWRIAHRVLGYISFPIGILQLALLPFFEFETIIKFSILTWVLIPSLYSLWFYYRKYKVQN